METFPRQEITLKKIREIEQCYISAIKNIGLHTDNNYAIFYKERLILHIVMLVTRHGVWNGNRCIEGTQLVTTSNYNALTNSHACLLTTTHAKSSRSSPAIAC
jgi:hypothetical protein